MLKEMLPGLMGHFAQVVATLIILFAIPLTKYIVRKLIRRFASKTFKSEGRISQIMRIISMIVNVTYLTSIAIVWGVDPENMVVALSSIFAVIGVALFAQWSILSNVTSGVIIFFSMPFHIGDEIIVMDKDMPIEARIENILSFVVHLRTKDGNLIVLSNSLFLQKTICVKDGKAKYEEYD